MTEFTPVTFFNSLTKKLEELKTKQPGIVNFYSCGPTTYNFMHVGNARAMVMGDFITRVLRYLGYRVRFVRNFTDVDDKIIEQAKKRGIDPRVHAQEFVQECQTDMNHMKLLPPDVAPRVTETMPEIIKMIQVLIENKAAYENSGEVYFHVPAFKSYGALSGQNLDSLSHGHRVEVDRNKKHPSDFVLWKPASAEELGHGGSYLWESPWGKGRPGWHIECSAMAKKFLGDEIDLHHGGVDLIFPHHENEIAQSQAANSCTFCSQWIHHEFINFAGEKMSKSLGNVSLIRDFVSDYTGLVLRHLLLMFHHRTRVEWTDELIQQAIGEQVKIHEFLVEYDQQEQVSRISVEVPDAATNGELKAQILKVKQSYRSALAKDFHVSEAKAELFGFLRAWRQLWHRGVLIDANNYKLGRQFLNDCQQTLAIFDENPAEHLKTLKLLQRLEITGGSIGQGVSDEWIAQKISERAEARAQKNFKLSDQIRDELLAKGIKIKDLPDGGIIWE